MDEKLNAVIKACESRRVSLGNERDTWVAHWRELAEYILPWRARFDREEPGEGTKRHGKIYDSTATFAARTLASGMMANLTSPARPWFELLVGDSDLNKRFAVRRWLHEVTQRISEVFLRSNFYQALPALYMDIGVFGTGLMSIEEDERDVIRCHVFPIGTYMLATGKRKLVDTVYREFHMTLRQIAMEFGTDTLPVTMRSNFDNNTGLEEPHLVVHVVQPREDYERGTFRSAKTGKRADLDKPIRSIYYLPGSRGEDVKGVLRDQGYYEMPMLAGRWAVTGEDVYGWSPGVESLADVKQLQTETMHKLEILEKLANPPWLLPAKLKQSSPQLRPGKHVFYDNMQNGNPAIPLYQPQHAALADITADIQETQFRISRAFYEDIFLMIARDRRLQRATATEVDEKREEKMLAMGTVIERLKDEVFDPAIDRVFAVLMRRGELPEAPPEIQGLDYGIENISTMAQAQRLVASGGIERWSQFASLAAQVDPEALDVYNADEALRHMAHMLGVPPNLSRTKEEVEARRERRAQAEQAQAGVAMAKDAASAAKDASSADLGGENVLQRLLRQRGAEDAGIA